MQKFLLKFTYFLQFQTRHGKLLVQGLKWTLLGTDPYSIFSTYQRSISSLIFYMLCLSSFQVTNCSISFSTKVGDSKTSRSFGKDDFKLFDSFAYGRCPTIGDNTIIFKTILDEISIFMPMGHFSKSNRFLLFKYWMRLFLSNFILILNHIQVHIEVLQLKKIVGKFFFVFQDESERHVDIWFSNSGSETFGSVGMFVGDTSMHSLEAGMTISIKPMLILMKISI